MMLTDAFSTVSTALVTSLSILSFPFPIIIKRKTMIISIIIIICFIFIKQPMCRNHNSVWKTELDGFRRVEAMDGRKSKELPPDALKPCIRRCALHKPL